MIEPYCQLPTLAKQTLNKALNFTSYKHVFVYRSRAIRWLLVLYLYFIGWSDIQINVFKAAKEGDQFLSVKIFKNIWWQQIRSRSAKVIFCSFYVTKFLKCYVNRTKNVTANVKQLKIFAKVQSFSFKKKIFHSNQSR